MTGFRPIRSADAGRGDHRDEVADGDRAEQRDVHRRGARLIEQEDVPQERDGIGEQDAARDEERQPRCDEPDIGTLLEDVGRPGLARDGGPGAAFARLRRQPRADAQDDAGHRHQLDDRDRDQGEREVAEIRGEIGQGEADEIAGDLHHPDHAAGESDLGWGDEVRDVALERAAGDVRGEPEQDHERRDRDERVRVGDAQQEDDVEQRAHDDERLAPAPARDGVVADRADGRLHGDGDGGGADGHEGRGEAEADVAAKVRVGEAEADEQADRRIDRGQAQPVRGDAQEMRQWQERGGSTVDLDGLVRAGPSRALDRHVGPLSPSVTPRRCCHDARPRGA